MLNTKLNGYAKLNLKGDTMTFSDKEHSYIESDEEREEGHADTRHHNFECESKSSLGCDPKVDVAG